MLQLDEPKPVEITKNACGPKNYLHPHRHLHHKTMQNSKSRQKRTFPIFSRFSSSCFRFLPHFLMNFPLFRLHEVATLIIIRGTEKICFLRQKSWSNVYD